MLPDAEIIVLRQQGAEGCAVFQSCDVLRQGPDQRRGQCPVSPHDVLSAYSEGRISSVEAIGALHLGGFRELLLAMSDVGHPMPRPPQDETDAQVAAALPIGKVSLIT